MGHSISYGASGTASGTAAGHTGSHWWHWCHCQCMACSAELPGPTVSATARGPLRLPLPLPSGRAPALTEAAENGVFSAVAALVPLAPVALEAALRVGGALGELADPAGAAKGRVARLDGQARPNTRAGVACSVRHAQMHRHTRTRTRTHTHTHRVCHTRTHGSQPKGAGSSCQ